MSYHLEIERKFLVTTQNLPAPKSIQSIRQSYIFIGEDRICRIRHVDDRYVLFVKISTSGIGKHEFGYDVPEQDGEAMFEYGASRSPIIKKRHIIEHQGHVWEIDIFEGENAGLIIAEIELKDENEGFVRPDWIGPEITADHRFSNSYLFERPFSSWAENYDDLLAQKS